MVNSLLLLFLVCTQATSWQQRDSLPPSLTNEPQAVVLNNGHVLVAGVSESNITYTLANSSATWQATPATYASHLYAPLTLLASGRVLFSGGSIASNTIPVASAEIYDPDARTWTKSPSSLNKARFEHTATLLPDGTVLICGGRGLNLSEAMTSCEIYDESAGTFIEIAAMLVGRSGHTATLLPSGAVMMVGGWTAGFECPTAVHVFDMINASFSAAGALLSGRRYHTATLLPSGSVLVVGGSLCGASSGINKVDLCSLSGCSALMQLTDARFQHTATLISPNEVLVAGGYLDISIILSSVEIYSISQNTWTVIAELPTARAVHASVKLSGEVLIIAGHVISSDTSVATAVYSYDISTRSPTQHPTSSPTPGPTRTRTPTAGPTSSPTPGPTRTRTPTAGPTSNTPTSSPTRAPSSAPTASPSNTPTASPSRTPTVKPTSFPTIIPTGAPNRPPTSPTVSWPCPYAAERAFLSACTAEDFVEQRYCTVACWQSVRALVVAFQAQNATVSIASTCLGTFNTTKLLELRTIVNAQERISFSAPWCKTAGSVNSATLVFSTFTLFLPCVLLMFY